MCEKDGCFNVKRRPKIEVFADCFPGKISFGDVDGIVEINGRALLLEWKPSEKSIMDGQRIMYERITVGGLLTVLIVVGNAETMEIKKASAFVDCKQAEWVDCDLQKLKGVIKRWRAWATSQVSFVSSSECHDGAIIW